MRILDAQAMREVDRSAIEDIGIPSLVLMENAAIGVVDAIGESYPRANSVSIFCGPGNNGGDGLAVARHLAGRGYQIEVSVIGSGKGLQGDARVQLDICQRQGLDIQQYAPGDAVVHPLETAERFDLVVDALFGTGLTRPLTGHYAEAVQAINALPVPCLAVDLPSGLDASSAAIMGPHVQSEMTVTFAALKVAHVLPPAAEAVGQVVVADLGIPPELVDRAAGDLHWIDVEEVSGLWSPRSLTDHKGDFGHGLIVAGSIGKTGAAVLAAKGAVRSGCGLVTVAAPEAIAQSVDLGSLESMTLPLVAGHDGLHRDSVQVILEFSRDKQALAVGPGLGTAPATVEVIKSIVLGSRVPVVLDADGVNAFSGAADLLAGCEVPRVLTPHPGELARLMGVTTAEILTDRVAAVRAAARTSGSIVLLKGYRTLIADPAGAVYVNSTGNPGMASGGTGDVLTGMICGLVSQGYSARTAACLGAFLHGLAGDQAAMERGQESMTASDLLDHLPVAFRALQP